MAKTRGGHSQSKPAPLPRGSRPPPTISNRKRKEDAHAAAGPARGRGRHVDSALAVQEDIGLDIERDAHHPVVDLLGPDVDFGADGAVGDEDQQDVPSTSAAVDAHEEAAPPSTFPFLGGPEVGYVLPTYVSHFVRDFWDGQVRSTTQ